MMVAKRFFFFLSFSYFVYVYFVIQFLLQYTFPYTIIALLQGPKKIAFLFAFNDKKVKPAQSHNLLDITAKSYTNGIAYTHIRI